MYSEGAGGEELAVVDLVLEKLFHDFQILGFSLTEGFIQLRTVSVNCYQMRSPSYIFTQPVTIS